MISVYGWRGTYELIGWAGIIIAFLLLLGMRDPKKQKILNYLNDKESLLKDALKNNDDFYREEAPVKKQVGFFESIVGCFRETVPRNCLIATSFRFFGNFVADYYSPSFYSAAYPNDQNEYALLSVLVYIIAGISNFYGGAVADKYGDRDPGVLGRLCMWSSAFSFPLMAASMLVTSNFRLSMAFTALKFMTGEIFWSPNVTMFQKAVEPHKFGSYYAVYQFFANMIGCLGTLVVGYIVNKLECQTDGVVFGYVVAALYGMGCLGSILFWYFAKVGFEEQQKEKHNLLNSRAFIVIEDP